jgi:hypothetical protein
VVDRLLPLAELKGGVLIESPLIEHAQLPLDTLCANLCNLRERKAVSIAASSSIICIVAQFPP